MSLLESNDGRAEEFEKWLKNEPEDYFGAHKGSKRYLEPDQEEQLHGIVEWNDTEHPADVHVSDSEAAIAHPVGQPCFVIGWICICLQGSDTLECWVENAYNCHDLFRETACKELENDVVENTEAA